MWFKSRKMQTERLSEYQVGKELEPKRSQCPVIIFVTDCGNDGAVGIWQIDESQFLDSSVTFHGRDIFAPTAAKIASGKHPDSLGRPISEQELIQFEFQPRQVVHIDQKFGNLKINGSIPEGPTGITLHHSAPLAIPFARTFADVEIGYPLALRGSDDFLEIAINQGNAAQQLGYQVGDCLHIEWHF